MLRSVGVYLHSGAWHVFKLAACGRVLGGISVYSAGFLEFTQARNRKRYRKKCLRVYMSSRTMYLLATPTLNDSRGEKSCTNYLGASLIAPVMFPTLEKESSKRTAVLNIGFRIFHTCLLRSSRFPLHYGGETGRSGEKSQFGAANRTPLAPLLDQQGASSHARSLAHCVLGIEKHFWRK